MHDELLQLMMKFELCYAITDCPDYYLTPHLLPASAPNADWDKNDNLELNYRYGFMPKGLLSRLMVRLHRYVNNTEEAWRSGVIFERTDARARVVETRGEKYLKIQAKGSESRELITVISEEIDRLNGGYHKLKVEKLVPASVQSAKRWKYPIFTIMKTCRYAANAANAPLNVKTVTMMWMY